MTEGSKAPVKWTEIKIDPPGAKEIIWPLWDYLWVQHSNGDYYLSRDQGETLTKVGRLRYRLWTLYRRITYQISRIKGRNND